jgi:hypothetical protein
MANAVRIGDAYGIYARDVFNRAAFRIHLARLGMEFSTDPYVNLLSSGRFSCRDWGKFEPAFLIGGGPYPEDDYAVEDRRGGLTPFMLGVLRIGKLDPAELAHLARFIRRAPILVSNNPRAVLESLKAA